MMSAAVESASATLQRKPVNHGAITAAITTTDVATASPRDGRKSNAMVGADFIDDGGEALFVRLALTRHPAPEFGIRCVEQRVECCARSHVCDRKALAQPPVQQSIELARAASAAPAQPADVG